MVDGDPNYGAPVWTKMTNLIVGENYVVSFYQASSEEDGSNQHYHDSWEVYVIPGASSGPYLCPQSNCAGVTTQATDPTQLAYTSPVMNNTGAVSTPWVKESFGFNATNTSEILEFVTNAVIVGAGTFVPPFLALADVTLDTPEPGTWALAALGVGLVFGAARRRSAARG
jgi:MYXO-CTERM domain-containing protein